ncbi:hypothetical protein CPB84DRAFT_1677721, partial [Gymnopilus junonius]
SKECQTASWQSSHKLNCRTHPSNEPASKAKPPAKFSLEWMELEEYRVYTRWIELWRSCFQTWATIAMNLANHPPSRVMTHW